jgi:hypothetical protein
MEDMPLILVDELGASVKNILKRNFIYRNDLNGAINVLLIILVQTSSLFTDPTFQI